MSKQPRAGGEEILECQVMWEPDGKKNTQMDRFREAVGAACGLALGECGRAARGLPGHPVPGARALQKPGSPSERGPLLGTGAPPSPGRSWQGPS